MKGQSQSRLEGLRPGPSQCVPLTSLSALLQPLRCGPQGAQGQSARQPHPCTCAPRARASLRQDRGAKPTTTGLCPGSGPHSAPEPRSPGRPRGLGTPRAAAVTSAPRPASPPAARLRRPRHPQACTARRRAGRGAVPADGQAEGAGLAGGGSRRRWEKGGGRRVEGTGWREEGGRSGVGEEGGGGRWEGEERRGRRREEEGGVHLAPGPPPPPAQESRPSRRRAAPYHSARACGRQSGGGGGGETVGRSGVLGPPGPGPPGPSPPRLARPFLEPHAPHPGTTFARSGTAAAGRGRLPVSPRALLSLGFGGRPRGIVCGGGGPPLGRTHTHTHTLGGARTRGDRPRGRGARPAERGGGRSGPGGPPSPGRARAGLTGGRRPRRRTAALGPRPPRRVPLPGGPRWGWWGRGGAPCACAFRVRARCARRASGGGVTGRAAGAPRAASPGNAACG